MQFELDEDKLQKCLPKNKHVPELLEALLEVLPNYEINTVERVAAFLAQCGHESLDFTVLHENLNYGAKGLRGIFPKYFGDDHMAAQYERKPEKIANKIYGGRMGNGPESSGDGYRYRGRGAIQLTGYNNYSAFAESIDMSVDDVVEYCETLEGAIESACWFWTKNNLNDIADDGDMLKLTKRINGGTIGLEERTSHYNRNLDILGD